nr:unnamed protein product [Digitaria exilis]
MMDGTRPPSSAAAGDRLSKLGDRVLGHILSFLPATEAARAALLSSRWRHVFAAVHTVSLEEPVAPLPDYNDGDDDADSWDWNRAPPDPNAPPPFHCTVTNALLARVHRRRRGGAAPPLRALRVAIEDGDRECPQESLRAHSTTVDQWVSYAVEQAAPGGLHLDLRLGRVPLCKRPYSLLRRRSGGERQGASSLSTTEINDEIHLSVSRSRLLPPPTARSRRGAAPSLTTTEIDLQRRRIYRFRNVSTTDGGSSDYDDYAAHTGSRRPSPPLSSSSSDDSVFWPSPRGQQHDDEAARGGQPWWERPRTLNTMPTALFTCADLRSLSLGLCRLDPPANVGLPSLETLLLCHVSGTGRIVERIIAGSPRLVDLTLEACREVVSLYVPSRTRLRRLALRCCHSLATVVLDASDLVAFEYRGAVPSSTLLTLHGGTPKVTYCKVDICGEVSYKEEDTRLGRFVQLFASTTKRLHLESARLGFGIDDDDNFPALPNLRHLELRGRVPSDDTAVVGVVSRMLGHAANLRALSLFFHPEEHDRWAGLSYIREYNEEELLDTHRLKYNGQSVPDVPTAAMAPCLSSSVREINLVHYQGGRAQRALAKFLLRNAPVIHKLWCEFAEGDLWTQTQLMREIKGWVMNKSANTQFL